VPPREVLERCLDADELLMTRAWDEGMTDEQQPHDDDNGGGRRSGGAAAATAAEAAAPPSDADPTLAPADADVGAVAADAGPAGNGDHGHDAKSVEAAAGREGTERLCDAGDAQGSSKNKERNSKP
jgi:hypothetical protein